LSKQATFEAIIDATRPLIQKGVSHYLWNKDEEDDVVQEIYYKLFILWKNKKISKIENLDSYLYIMTKNTCFLWNKKQKNHERIDETLLTESHPPTPPPNLKHLIQTLPEPYLSTLSFVIEGYSLKELSQKLFININTLKSHLRRAKLILKKEGKLYDQ